MATDGSSVILGYNPEPSGSRLPDGAFHRFTHLTYVCIAVHCMHCSALHATTATLQRSYPSWAPPPFQHRQPVIIFITFLDGKGSLGQELLDRRTDPGMAFRLAALAIGRG